MASEGIVEAFGVIEHIGSGVIARAVDFFADAFGFQ
jgi:hypothetical protein